MSQLIICSRDDVQDILKSRDVAAVLSIENPDDNPTTKGYAPRHTDRPQKILQFWDADEPRVNGPDIAQIKEGIEFALEQLKHGDVLIHCHFGKSRSVGVALGVLAQQYPDDSGAELLEKLLKIRPESAPNILIVQMGDELAGRKGELVKALFENPTIDTQRRESIESRRAQAQKRPPQPKKPAGPRP